MSKWIDAEWILNFFEPYPNDYQTPLGLLRACVDDAPSIDIVSCKECKYWVSDGGALMICDIHKDPTVPDHFCSYGERESE